MDKLPIEIQDEIFSYTNLNTCILNDNKYIIKKYNLIDEIIFEKDLTLKSIMYCFDNFLEDIIKRIKTVGNQFILYFVKFNDIEIIEYIISKYIDKRIFTKFFRYELTRAFETACYDDKYIHIARFMYNKYIHEFNYIDYRRISENVIKSNNINLIVWLFSIKKLWYSRRGVETLKLLHKNEYNTILLLNWMRDKISLNQICYYR